MGELPVDVLLARNDRAGVTTAHRHDEVRPFDVVARQRLRNSAGCVDTYFLQRIGDHRVDFLGRLRACRACFPAALLVERLRDLRAARVLDADEENAGHPPRAPRSAETASGTRR